MSQEGMGGRKLWAGLLGIGLCALLVLQLQHFMEGYRLTADDTMFLQYAWRGWGHVWEAAREFAILSGRIGHFMITPLNALGAYWATSWLARALMVMSYFGVMVLFACYASQLLASGSRRVAAFMLLGMLALHPLAYEHMPPTAYPLQNTLPFLIVLAVRLWLWCRERVSLPLLLCLYALQGLAMLVSEYVLLLASALMAVEHLTTMVSPRQGVAQRWLWGLRVRRGRLLADVLLAALVLAAYLLFRLAFPSQYEGNSIDGLVYPERFLLTSFYHVAAGTALYRIPDLPLDAISATTWAMASLVATLTFACAWYLLLRLPLLSWRRAVASIAVTAFFMLYMAFPLAATSRQQQWCLELQSCGYLDSRTSYLGVAVLLYCLTSLLLMGRARRITAPLLAVMLALGAGLNYAGNQRIAHDMSLRTQPWQAAQELACDLPPGTAIHPETLQTIDPHRLVSFHSYVDTRVYWVEYLNHLRASGRCGTGLAIKEGELRDPFYMQFSEQGFVTVGEPRGISHEVLGEGWSYAEPWGIWSHGEYSTLQLDLSDPALAGVTALDISFDIYMGPSVSNQRVDVWLNGVPIDSWKFSEESIEKCCRRRIDLNDQVGRADVELRLEYLRQRNPEYPGEGDDPRRLALGLHLLELVEEGE